MATDINNTIVVGRLTRDSELKYTNSGQPVTKFSIANNYSKKNGDQWEELTNFFDVTLWGKRGESLNQYLLKGTQIAVTGELRQDRWEQDGQQRSRVLINANNIQLLGGKSTNGQANNNAQQGYNSPRPNNNGNPSTNSQQNQQGGNGNFKDDIPF